MRNVLQTVEGRVGEDIIEERVDVENVNLHAEVLGELRGFGREDGVEGR